MFLDDFELVEVGTGHLRTVILVPIFDPLEGDGATPLFDHHDI